MSQMPNLTRKQVSKKGIVREILIERPHQRLIVWGSSSKKFYLPMPYIYYHFERMYHGQNWMLSSVEMRAYLNGESRIACLPNIYASGMPCMTRNANEDQVALLAHFWEGRYNGELRNYRDHPVWRSLAEGAGVSPMGDAPPIFAYWESLTIRQFQQLWKKSMIPAEVHRPSVQI